MNINNSSTGQVFKNIRARIRSSSNPPQIQENKLYIDSGSINMPYAAQSKINFNILDHFQKENSSLHKKHIKIQNNHCSDNEVSFNISPDEDEINDLKENKKLCLNDHIFGKQGNSEYTYTFESNIF